MEHSTRSTFELANSRGLRQYEEETLSVQHAGLPGAGQGSPQAAPNAIQDHANALVALLSGRDDREEILAAAVAQLTPPTHVPDVQQQAGPAVLSLPKLDTGPEEPAVGTPFEDMTTFELNWCFEHGTAVEVAAAHAAFRLLDEREQHGDVEFVREMTWSARDAKLRANAVELSSPSPPSPQSPQQSPVKPFQPFSTDRVADEMPTAPSKPSPASTVVKPLSPAPLLDTTSLPESYQHSPDVGFVRKVLGSAVDLTLKLWFTRALYISDVVTAWSTWADPSSPPHRDSADALAVFAESESLDVPPDLLSPDPDIADTAWDHYRGMLINSLHRALVAGVDWRQILRHLVVRYKHPNWGHPRLVEYVAEALQDPVLLGNPPLHADVLIRQLDESFSVNSSKFNKRSVSAEWDQTVSRRAGEDCVSLARRVVNAYLRKLGDASITATNFFLKPYHLDAINERYSQCLKNDLSDRERGRLMNLAFNKEWSEISDRYEEGEAIYEQYMLSCIRIARTKLNSVEGNLRREGAISTTVVNVGRDVVGEFEAPDDPPLLHDYAYAPPLTYAPRHRPAGRGSREKRTERRAQLRREMEALDE